MVAFQIHAVLFIIPLKFLILHEISIAFCYTNIKPWGLLPSEPPPAGGKSIPQYLVFLPYQVSRFIVAVFL
jgi:hypothetical protein